jgi:hypothetical protein
MKLKTLDLNEKSFTANGVEYFIESEISIQRSVYAEACKIELENGLKAGKWLEDWVKVYDLANEQKFADIVVLAYNNRRGFKDFFKNHPAVVKLCAVFINAADEDRRTITDTMVDKKVNDWVEEGITIQSFFGLALSFLRIEVTGYQNATQAILEMVKAYQKDLSAELSTPISV